MFFIHSLCYTDVLDLVWALENLMLSLALTLSGAESINNKWHNWGGRGGWNKSEITMFPVLPYASSTCCYFNNHYKFTTIVLNLRMCPTFAQLSESVSNMLVKCANASHEGYIHWGFECILMVVNVSLYLKIKPFTFVLSLQFSS
jgi:hypothetical protein